MNRLTAFLQSFDPGDKWREQPDRKRTLCFAAVTGVLVLAAVWFTLAPLTDTFTIPTVQEYTGLTGSSAAMQLSRNARRSLIREHSSGEQPYQYYARRGALYDCTGTFLYSNDTILTQIEPGTYERSLGVLAAYLYGDVDERGYEALLRCAYGDDSTDLTLTLDTALEAQIWDLLTRNHISGGCIILRGGGAVQCMVSTTGTRSQLAASISGTALTRMDIGEEDARLYFDYHNYFLRTQEDTVGDYCYKPDFGYLTEENDRLSPLHLTDIVQRIFTGTCTEARLLQAVSGSIAAAPSDRQAAQIPAEVAGACKRTFSVTRTNSHTLYSFSGNSRQEQFVTGWLEIDGDGCAITVYGTTDIHALEGIVRMLEEQT